MSNNILLANPTASAATSVTAQSVIIAQYPIPWFYGLYALQFQNPSLPTAKPIISNGPSTDTPALTQVVSFIANSISSIGSCVGKDWLGYPVQTNTTSGNNASILANSITTVNNCIATSASLYLPIATGNIELAIYNDSSGPNTLIGYTNAAIANIGWNTLPLTSSVQLSPGKYWISFETSDNGVSVSSSNTTSSNGAMGSANYGAFPTTFPTPITAYTYAVSLYTSPTFTTVVNLGGSQPWFYGIYALNESLNSITPPGPSNLDTPILLLNSLGALPIISGGSLPLGSPIMIPNIILGGASITSKGATLGAPLLAYSIPSAISISSSLVNCGSPALTYSLGNPLPIISPTSTVGSPLLTYSLFTASSIVSTISSVNTPNLAGTLPSGISILSWKVILGAPLLAYSLSTVSSIISAGTSKPASSALTQNLPLAVSITSGSSNIGVPTLIQLLSPASSISTEISSLGTPILPTAFLANPIYSLLTPLGSPDLSTSSILNPNSISSRISTIGVPPLIQIGTQIYKAFPYGAFPLVFPTGWNTSTPAYSVYSTLRSVIESNGVSTIGNPSLAYSLSFANPIISNISNLGTPSLLGALASASPIISADVSVPSSPMLSFTLSSPVPISSIGGFLSSTFLTITLPSANAVVSAGTSEPNTPSLTYSIPAAISLSSLGPIFQDTTFTGVSNFSIPRPLISGGLSSVGSSLLAYSISTAQSITSGIPTLGTPSFGEIVWFTAIPTISSVSPLGNPPLTYSISPATTIVSRASMIGVPLLSYSIFSVESIASAGISQGDVPLLAYSIPIPESISSTDVATVQTSSLTLNRLLSANSMISGLSSIPSNPINQTDVLFGTPISAPGASPLGTSTVGSSGSMFGNSVYTNPSIIGIPTFQGISVLSSPTSITSNISTSGVPGLVPNSVFSTSGLISAGTSLSGTPSLVQTISVATPISSNVSILGTPPLIYSLVSPISIISGVDSLGNPLLSYSIPSATLIISNLSNIGSPLLSYSLAAPVAISTGISLPGTPLLPLALFGNNTFSYVSAPGTPVINSSIPLAGAIESYPATVGIPLLLFSLWNANAISTGICIPHTSSLGYSISSANPIISSDISIPGSPSLIPNLSFFPATSISSAGISVLEKPSINQGHILVLDNTITLTSYVTTPSLGAADGLLASIIPSAPSLLGTPALIVNIVLQLATKTSTLISTIGIPTLSKVIPSATGIISIGVLPGVPGLAYSIPQASRISSGVSTPSVPIFGLSANTIISLPSILDTAAINQQDVLVPTNILSTSSYLNTPSMGSVGGLLAQPIISNTSTLGIPSFIANSPLSTPINIASNKGFLETQTLKIFNELLANPTSSHSSIPGTPALAYSISSTEAVSSLGSFNGTPNFVGNNVLSYPISIKSYIPVFGLTNLTYSLPGAQSIASRVASSATPLLAYSIPFAEGIISDSSISNTSTLVQVQTLPIVVSLDTEISILSIPVLNPAGTPILSKISRLGIPLLIYSIPSATSISSGIANLETIELENPPPLSILSNISNVGNPLLDCICYLNAIGITTTRATIEQPIVPYRLASISPIVFPLKTLIDTMSRQIASNEILTPAFDPELKLETTITQVRAVREATTTIPSLDSHGKPRVMPIFAFKPGPIKWSALGRRGTRHCILRDPYNKAFQINFYAYQGQVDIGFALFHNSIQMLDMYEVAYMSKARFSNIRHIDVTYPDPIGTMPYQITWGDLDDKITLKEPVEHQAILGVLRIEGAFIVFDESPNLLINKVIFDIMNWQQAVYSTITFSRVGPGIPATIVET